MKRALASLLVLLCLPMVGLGVASGTDLQLYSFNLNGTKMQVMREVMTVNWKSDPSYHNDGSSPKAIMGKTILMKPSPGGVRPGGDLGNIQQVSLYWTSFERAYHQVLKQTENLPTNAALEVNRLVGGTIPNVDDGYAATIAVHLMAMFQSTFIPNTSILVGALQSDGRVGPVGLLPAKVLLLLPYAQKIYIPSGQLTTLSPSVMNQIQQRQVTIEEVDTIEQAYQLMIRTR
jgi:hypothetical protein